MTWQTRLTRANATSLCTSAYYLRHHYQCIIFGLWFFWAYDFVCVWFCVRMICVRMIFLCVWFFLSVWFVCVWFFCAYNFHDDAPVPVAYHKNSNKWTMYSDFLNFRLWKHNVIYREPGQDRDPAHPYQPLKNQTYIWLSQLIIAILLWKSSYKYFKI